MCTPKHQMTFEFEITSCNDESNWLGGIVSVIINSWNNFGAILMSPCVDSCGCFCFGSFQNN